MKYRVRCGKCKKRAVFNKKPSFYKKPKICENCGNDHFFIDRYRQSKKETKLKNSCFCNAYPFKHQFGSGQCINKEEHLLNMAARNTGGIKSEEMLF